MSNAHQSILTRPASAYEMFEAESLRRIAAEVPTTPDYRAERRELVITARRLRLHASQSRDV